MEAEGSNNEQSAILYDSVPVPDSNQFADTGVSQPTQPADLSQPAHDANPKAEGEAGPNTTDPTANPERPEPAQGAPEAYEFKDADKYDQKVLQGFEEAARKANLSQDAAQALMNTVVPVMAQRQAERIAEIRQSWVNESMRDQTLSNGGDERVFLENLALAKRGFDAVADPDGSIRSIMNETGLGNHPAILKMFMKIGRTIAPDSFVGGRAPVQQTRSAAEILYGNGDGNGGH